MKIKNNTFLKSSEFRLFLALAGILFVLLVVTLIKEGKPAPLETPAVAAAKNPFQGIKITAKAAYVYDVRTKTVLYEKNADARLPLASVTKVMTALVATSLASDDIIITVPKEALETEGDSGLLGGERWKLKDLLDFSLTSSSNDGMAAIAMNLGAEPAGTHDPLAAEAAFIKDMNAKADELQMKNTYYLNETGLDVSAGQAGAYGSARDMAKLFEYILSTEPGLLEATQEKSFSISSENATHTATNTDILANFIPGLIASKTGYTDLAGGNLVIAFDPELDRPVIVSVLGSTEDGRFEDVATLVDKAMEAIRND